MTTKQLAQAAGITDANEMSADMKDVLDMVKAALERCCLDQKEYN